MKKVFNSNAQLTHIWAQQSQNEGSSSSIFFEGDKIYSYGHHYLAGEFHISGKKKFVLINNSRYSNTTSNHVRLVANAVRGLYPHFYTSTPSNPNVAYKEIKTIAQNSIGDALKISKVSNNETIGWELNQIKEAFDLCNQLGKLLGKKNIKPKEKDLKAVKKHLDTRLIRYQELNTPEAIAAKQAKILKANEKKNAELIQKFNSGENVIVKHLDHEKLRIRGSVVETSRGAQVPLSDAKRLLMAIMNGKNMVGFNIGEFTVEKITEVNNDKIVKIGCHKILLSEAKSVLHKAG